MTAAVTAFGSMVATEYLRRKPRREQGKVFAWIDTKPEFVTATDWDTRFILKDPEKPGKRRFRLSLIGGGQIRVSETFVPMTDWNGEDQGWVWRDHPPKLKVQAQMNDGLHTYNGINGHSTSYEMSADAVVFPLGTPQEVAGRTAETFRLIKDADSFVALLSRNDRCSFCRRPLKDEVSKLIGIGPDCAEKNGIPHNHKVASRALELRRNLLASVAE